MLKSLKHKIRKRLKNKKGSMIIEYAIGLLMFTVFVAFVLDLFIIAHKHYYIGQEIAYVARTASVQSGFESITPKGFPGGSTAYQTSSEILNRFEKVAEAAGFEPDEWQLVYEEIDHNGNVVEKGVLKKNTHFEAEYLNKISIEFQAKYEWKALSGGLPFVGGERDMNVKRIVMAEYIRSYD